MKDGDDNVFMGNRGQETGPGQEVGAEVEHLHQGQVLPEEGGHGGCRYRQCADQLRPFN